jgi:hypothetical protein
MYGLAYVIIPARFESLQAELDRTLAPFQRGGEDVFPRERLAFKDATQDLHVLHGARFRYNPDGSLRWLAGDAAASYDLSLTALSEHMKPCRLDTLGLLPLIHLTAYFSHPSRRHNRIICCASMDQSEPTSASALGASHGDEVRADNSYA